MYTSLPSFPSQPHPIPQPLSAKRTGSPVTTASVCWRTTPVMLRMTVETGQMNILYAVSIPVKCVYNLEYVCVRTYKVLLYHECLCCTRYVVSTGV